MINPKELMIGNVALYDGSEVEIITILKNEAWVKFKGGSQNCIPYKELHPIPLTPSILERYGFKQTLNVPELYDAPKGFLDIINDYGSAWYNINGKVLEVGYYHNEIPITTLHHLQNIVKSITGKELEVKK